ncbi:hypothetical protein BpHYR1_017638 [Brachionus plicatilis]|uniref:Uncharacterized protein n=1 Tax=Brachionus plicatilis TaxID=10195 RepID=A0A3M7SEE2_BRAPC|nr:hypothetical protein BpHYR1_017638 [Brachionus plicatilis]
MNQNIIRRTNSSQDLRTRICSKIIFLAGINKYSKYYFYLTKNKLQKINNYFDFGRQTDKTILTNTIFDFRQNKVKLYFRNETNSSGFLDFDAL